MTMFKTRRQLQDVFVHNHAVGLSPFTSSLRLAFLLLDALIAIQPAQLEVH